MVLYEIYDLKDKRWNNVKIFSYVYILHIL